MTVAELVAELQKIEWQDAQVVIPSQHSEYDYTSPHTVSTQWIEWGVDDDGEELEEAESRFCLIIE